MGCRVFAGMGFVSRVLCVLLSVSCLASIASAQGLPQSPYAGPSLLGGGDVAGFNPLGAANTYDTIPLSSGMLGPYLPKIPNLELGFLYYFGNNVRTGGDSPRIMFSPLV